MGVKNRQRRRQKQGKRQRQHQGGRHRPGQGSGRTTGRSEPGGADLEWIVLVALAETAEALHHGRDEAPELLAGLVEGPPVHCGTSLVARAVRRATRDGIEELADVGWLPSEIVRMTRRRLGRAGADAAAAALHHAWRAGRSEQFSPAWAGEAGDLDATGWSLDPGAPTWPADLELAVRLYGLLDHLPPLPDVARTAGSWSAPGPDQRVLDRVRNLLSKAESTGFPEEAESLTAKAQELLTRYNLDRAAVESSTERRGRPEAVARRIWIDDPYVGPKAELLHRVAVANRCRTVLVESLGLAVAMGHPDDLDSVEILFTSLLVQGTSQLTRAGSRTDRRGRSRTRSFRQSFLVAFAVRIGQRLREAERASVAAAGEVGTALVPVLAVRREATDDLVDELFPDTRQGHTSAADREGWIAGTVAADHATLVVQPELLDGVA